MSGAGRRGRRRRRRGLVHKAPANLEPVRSEINVTPLVDVVLVLLIVFMVITELLARGKEVPLPKTRHHTTESDQNQPIVAMDGDGKIYFGKEEITSAACDGKPPAEEQKCLLGELKAHVREEWRTGVNKSQRVYVKADADLPYRKVYPLIMAMHELGLQQIDLGTHEKRVK